MVRRRHLTFGAIVALTTVYALKNTNFNSTDVVSSVIYTPFKWLKSANSGSYEKFVSRVNTKTLIDLQKTTLLKVTPHNDHPAKGMKSTIDIIWYNIPVWVNMTFHGNFLQRHCTYDNCRMSNNKTNIQSAEAVIFSLTQKMEVMPPVARNERNPDQVWVFFYLESPVHHYRKQYRHKNWRNTMNWSMSYQMDSDIFYPYGYLETRGDGINKNYSAVFHRKSKVAAWAVSHCETQSKRDKFVSELVSHGVQVVVFGKCSNSPALTNTELETLINKDYKFYLSFENSLCTDYITEKFFRYYNFDVVLVVRGGLDYEKYLPNGTFINTANFNSVKDLASFVIEVGSSEELYTSLLRNKDKYTAKNSPLAYTCSLCEKLNNLHVNRKIFENHVTYIHKNRCWSPADITFKNVSGL